MPLFGDCSIIKYQLAVELSLRSPSLLRGCIRLWMEIPPMGKRHLLARLFRMQWKGYWSHHSFTSLLMDKTLPWLESSISSIKDISTKPNSHTNTTIVIVITYMKNRIMKEMIRGNFRNSNNSKSIESQPQLSAPCRRLIWLFELTDSPLIPLPQAIQVWLQTPGLAWRCTWDHRKMKRCWFPGVDTVPIQNMCE